jgi:phage repressor protein C with HTH and peptisase S24 domain
MCERQRKHKIRIGELFLSAMAKRSTKSAVNQDGGVGICWRLAEVRQVVYGRRGRARLAREIGVSPSTYNYYERNRVPPAGLLARIATVTKARLEWLVTGQGPMFEQGTGENAIRTGLMGRLEALLGRAPRLEQPVMAFVLMLEEMAGTKAAGAAAPAVGSGLIPVIGGTAAGVARFWREYGPGGGGVTTLAERAEQVLGRALPRGRRPAELGGEPPGSPSVDRPTADADRTCALVQVSEPDGAGLVEFVECPFVRGRARDVFGLRIDGDSMSPRFEDGDLVLVSPDEAARDGRPAVVQLAGQIGATCKVYVPRGDRVHLVPINERYPAAEHAAADVEWALAVLWRVVLRS